VDIRVGGTSYHTSRWFANSTPKLVAARKRKYMCAQNGGEHVNVRDGDGETARREFESSGNGAG